MNDICAHGDGRQAGLPSRGDRQRTIPRDRWHDGGARRVARGEVTADALERLGRFATVARYVQDGTEAVRTGSADKIAANRDLRYCAPRSIGRSKGSIERTPFKRGDESTVKLTAEPARSRRLQAGEEDRLLPACGEHLRALVEAALETGCRRASYCRCNGTGAA